MSFGQPSLGRRDTAQRIFAELPVFLRNGRVEGQVLGRNDLVGVDVIAQDKCLTTNGLLHVYSP